MSLTNQSRYSLPASPLFWGFTFSESGCEYVSQSSPFNPSWLLHEQSPPCSEKSSHRQRQLIFKRTTISRAQPQTSRRKEPSWSRLLLHAGIKSTLSWNDASLGSWIGMSRRWYLGCVRNAPES